MVDWRAFGYRPASFRGVPFFVEDHDQQDGRRVDKAEFPLRDEGSTQDLGKQLGFFHLQAFVLGDTYLLQAEALYRACCMDRTPGMLVSPYLGEKRVRCDSYRRRENAKQAGAAQFDLVFVEAGAAPGPRSIIDTVAAVLGRVAGVAVAIRAAFGQAVNVSRDPLLLVPAIQAQLAAFSDAAHGLPLATAVGMPALLDAVSAAPADTAATAAAVLAATDGYVTAAISAGWSERDPSAGLLRLADASAGLASLGTRTPLRRAMSANQDAVTDLLRGAVALAIARLYAETTWFSADAAADARRHITALLDARALAAADAGQSALFAAWQALLAVVVQDLRDRAQRLPRRAAYDVADVLPAVALSQRLVGRADNWVDLVLLNAAPHPLFMPATGYMLVP